MGICVSEESNSVLNINTKLLKMNAEVSHKVEGLHKLIKIEESRLLSEFNKEANNRNKFQEENLAKEIVLKMNHITIYKIVQSHIQKLIDFNKNFETDSVPEGLQPSFKIIVYCDSILQDQNFTNFCLLLKQNYRKVCIVKDEDIHQELIKYHKYNHFPSKTMINEYLLNVINQNNLKFEEIKKVGHQIGFGI